MRRDPLDYLSRELDALKQQGLYRHLRILEGEQIDVFLKSMVPKESAEAPAPPPAAPGDVDVQMAE